MSGLKDKRPATVPEKAKQAGEVRTRWKWTEPSVWTERMLTALEQGVKGGVWYSLIDKVWSLRNLKASFAKVKANGGSPGVDHQTIEMFEGKLEANLPRLANQIRTETYRPNRIRRKYIPKPGSREKRPLGIRDRVVQGSLRNVLEPIFERDFTERSYGFRPGRSCKDALRRVETLLKKGYRNVVDADLKSYFDTIPHEALMERIRNKVADGGVLKLIEAYLRQGVLEGMKSWTPERGSPQGAVISPLLSNIYLDPLDHLMENKGYEMIRYADDFIIMCRNRASAEQALKAVQEWTAEAELTLHPDKTRIVNEQTKGFDFLGYHFENGKVVKDEEEGRIISVGQMLSLLRIGCSP